MARLPRRLGHDESVTLVDLSRLRRLAARDSVLELPHPAAERPPHLRQALGPEEEQENDQDDDDLGPTQRTHAARIARCLPWDSKSEPLHWVCHERGVLRRFVPT